MAKWILTFGANRPDANGAITIESESSNRLTVLAQSVTVLSEEEYQAAMKIYTETQPTTVGSHIETCRWRGWTVAEEPVGGYTFYTPPCHPEYTLHMITPYCPYCGKTVSTNSYAD